MLETKKDLNEQEREIQLCILKFIGKLINDPKATKRDLINPICAAVDQWRKSIKNVQEEDLNAYESNLIHSIDRYTYDLLNDPKATKMDYFGAVYCAVNFWKRRMETIIEEEGE